MILMTSIISSAHTVGGAALSSLSFARVRRHMPLLACAALAAAALPSGSGAAPASPGRAAETIPGSYIVVFHGSVASAPAKTDKLEKDKGFKARHRYGRAIKGFSARLSQRQVDELRRDAQVALVAPDRPVEASAMVPLAAGDSAPTGVRRMAAATTTSAREASTAQVAVIDTGIDLSHPDLNAADGRNCVSSGPAQDDEGHGTHVAGTIAARNNGSGVVGVAPGTRVRAVKVLDSRGSGTFSQIICGIDWVTSTRTDADPSNDISVANLSLGGPSSALAPCATTSDPLHRAICASTAAGVTYVVAAGNDGWDYDYAPAPDAPAVYPEVLTVTAASDSDGRPGALGGTNACGEPDDRYASFSNYATGAAAQAHTIAGPGVCIRSTLPGGAHGTMSGTSMASPHLAGAASLCRTASGACAGKTPAQVIATLRGAAQRYTTAIPGFGFAGDPTRPVSGRHYGFLDWSGVDTAAPQVSATTPAANATGVGTSSAVTVAFSEPMDRASAQSAFALRRADGSTVAGSFSWAGNTLTFRPASVLAGGAAYTASVGTGALDAAGNRLGAARTWSFTTLGSAGGSPSGTVLEVGSLRGGAASALSADDNVFYEIASTTTGTRTSSWYGRVTGVANSLTSLGVSYRGKSSATCSQTVLVFRWTTATWVQLDLRSVGPTEVQVDRPVTGTLADYVSGTTGDGEVRVRVRCTSTTTAFVTSGDMLRVTHTR
jgi:subtilisin family serine protease